MFSRRLLRIKILQILYAHYKVQDKPYEQSEKDLLHSIQKLYELYHYLLLLIIDVLDYAESKIELAAQKKIPTYEDLHPNTKFIDNRLVKQLKVNDQLNDYLKNKKLNWVNYPGIIKKLYNTIANTAFYTSYMDEEESSYDSDKKLILHVYQDVVINFEDLYLNLEEQSIYWANDVEFIIIMAVKTLKKFKEKDWERSRLMPLFSDQDDLDFTRILFRKTIINYESYNDLIKNSARNWELERIAFLDKLIMTMAIAEVIEFTSIPTKVTMNEYIEIAKVYSTQKSSQFINGILDHIFEKLKGQDKIIKRGRGLIGEA